MSNIKYFEKLLQVIPLVLLILFAFSCKQTEVVSEHNFVKNGKYDNCTHGVSISKQIENLNKSVKKLDVLEFYKTWHFAQNSRFTEEFIKKSDINDLSKNITISNESVSGTAFVIYYQDNLAGLLTCAHVINNPDTIFSYFTEEKKIVRSISIKIRHNIYIAGLIIGEDVEVVCIDNEKDIALLKKVIPSEGTSLKTIDLTIGSTDKLEWGSEVYVLGYPIGNLMLTKGIASIEKSKKKRILSDAMYNKGISGSPAFAILDGSSDFELVGMARSASARSISFLRPEENTSSFLTNGSRYFGDVYIKENLLINYGVTYSVPIEEIITFIGRNKNAIRDAGFNTDFLLTKTKTIN